MSKRPVRKSAGKSVPSEPSPVPAFLVACVLIGLFTYRFDAAMVVGLVVLRARLAAPIFWTALVAGVGLFVIRLTSESSWWTGHLLWTME